METRLNIEIGTDEFKAALTKRLSPKTVEALVEALPIESEAKKWGAEIYFDIPVDMAEENAQEIVSKCDIGYWPTGNALCIFYGKTPISESETEIRPVSAVNIVGSFEEPDRLKMIDPKTGEKIRIVMEG
ncbi:MAG: hypothetical protein C5S38_10150 [Candidatus Methanophagaceae archaeon]|nr:MAG: hypothetical protein C5S38_10150 [Methanophagales archaeon]KAF5429735.1 hypothetical protein C5S36_14830 [Methanophagales archaeon]